MPRSTEIVHVRLPKHIHRAIKIEAAQRSMTMSMIVLEALASRVINVRKASTNGATEGSQD